MALFSCSLKNAIEIDVLANDTDLDGEPQTVIEVNQGTQSSVQINGDGTAAATMSVNIVKKVRK